jgi:hypothetical protein
VRCTICAAWFDAACPTGFRPERPPAPNRLGVADRFWAGHRIYLAFDGTKLIILLGGGTKSRQQADFAQVIERRADCKRSKKAAKE